MSHAHTPDMNRLGKSEERHRLLLETLPHGVQENTCDGVITYSNPAHHAILGFSHGELLGRKIWDMQPSPGEREKLKKYLAYLVSE